MRRPVHEPPTIITSGLLLGALSPMLLGGWGDNRPPAERTLAFCEGIRVGQPFADVEARYGTFGMQAGGFARDPRERLDGGLTTLELQRVTGILAEPSRSQSGERPVCAIYYSDPFLGGDGRVVQTLFKPAWAHRF